MDTPADNPKVSSSRRFQEFEDPHFHDDADFEAPPEDSDFKRKAKGPAARKLPPPRRRFEDQ